MTSATADMSVSPAPYLPFMDRHKGKPPGLWALPPEDWIEIDAPMRRRWRIATGS